MAIVDGVITQFLANYRPVGPVNETGQRLSSPGEDERKKRLLVEG